MSPLGILLVLKSLLSRARGYMKLHEAQRLLREAGFEIDRQLGTSHQVWKRGDETFVLAVHKGKELKKVAEKKIRKLK